MPDNLQPPIAPKDVRINIHQKNELHYWTHKFGVSVINLKIAVSESSGKAGDVESWLIRNKYIS